MPGSYFLSPTAVNRLRDHKQWSLRRFGRAVTKKYFQDMDKGFQYIADHYRRFPEQAELTGESGLFLYPVREHYIVYLPLADGIHIADILGRAQDIPHILRDNAAFFRRELAQNFKPPRQEKNKNRKRKPEKTRS